MAKAKKICRICGKEYTPCSYCENDRMAFHYRTICCSRACARIYLDRVFEARNKSQAKESEVVMQSSEDPIFDTQEFEHNENVEEKPKRKYTRKKQTESESENIEQIDASGGTSD